MDRQRLRSEALKRGHFVDGHVQTRCDLIEFGRAPFLRFKCLSFSGEALDLFMHMDRNANRPAFVGEMASNLLPYPPSGVSGELEATPPIEALDGFQQADVSFLYQVVQG